MKVKSPTIKRPAISTVQHIQLIRGFLLGGDVEFDLPACHHNHMQIPLRQIGKG